MTYTILDVLKMVNDAVKSLKLDVNVELKNVGPSDDEPEYIITVDDYLEIGECEIETPTIAGTRNSKVFYLNEWVQSGGSYWEPPDVDEVAITCGSSGHVVYELIKIIVMRPVDGYFENYEMTVDHILSEENNC